MHIWIYTDIPWLNRKGFFGLLFRMYDRLTISVQPPWSQMFEHLPCDTMYLITALSGLVTGSHSSFIWQLWNNKFGPSVWLSCQRSGSVWFVLQYQVGKAGWQVFQHHALITSTWFSPNNPLQHLWMSQAHGSVMMQMLGGCRHLNISTYALQNTKFTYKLSGNCVATWPNKGERRLDKQLSLRRANEAHQTWMA